jgi:hypothetical protein
VRALPPTGSIKSIMTTDAAMLSVKKSSNILKSGIKLFFNGHESEFF